jgi:hypothetical protein
MIFCHGRNRGVAMVAAAVSAVVTFAGVPANVHS